MGEASNPDAIIIGAGLAGSLLACYLAARSLRVAVYERRADPRSAGYAGGRSINLALSRRGIWGLEGVGLHDRVLKHALPMRGRMMHPASGGLVYQPYSADPTEAINSISRSALNLTLIEAAASMPGVSLHFDRQCVFVDLDSGRAVFAPTSAGRILTEHDPRTTETAHAQVIIGTDGASSAVRACMLRQDRFEYSQSYLGHGYKELHIPSARDLGLGAGHDGWAMDPRALHIWPRGGAMMIALPNPDKTFTCTLFWPWEGPHGFDQLKTAEAVAAHFSEHYPDTPVLIPNLAADYLANPTGSLVTVRCWPWVRPGRSGHALALLGDASHAIVPFYGQGMNAAFEDCRILAECFDRSGAGVAGSGAGRGEGGWPCVLDEFQRLRKPNADAIAEMALDNFVEMRDKVGSPAFLYRKRLEQAVHALFPGRFTPRYNLVSFSTVPYVEAQRRGLELESLIEQIIPLVPLLTHTDEPDDRWRRRVEEAVRSLGERPT